MNNKKLFLLGFGTWLLFTALQGYTQKTEYYVTSLAFYNLENLFDTEDNPKKYDEHFTPSGEYKYTQEIYKKKLHNLSKVLSEIATDQVPGGPALIGVAEVENNRVLKDLLSTPLLKERAWKSICIEGADVRGINVGLIYNPNLFKITEAKSHYVDLDVNGKKEWTRDILQVTGLLIGDTIHVLVCHWPSRRGGEGASQWKREKAASVCKRIKDEIVALDPGARVIIMGDLNDDPVSLSVEKVLEAKGEVRDVGTGELFNPFYMFYKKGMGTLAYNDSWNLFDQIIISSAFIHADDLSWKYRQAYIFNKNYLRNQFGQYKGYPHRSYTGTTWTDGYSDHFPTYILISKEKK